MYKFFVILLLILILFSTCTGCTFMIAKKTAKIIDIIKPEKKEEFICTKIDCGNEDIDELIEEEKRKQNIIACIKVKPECEW